MGEILSYSMLAGLLMSAMYLAYRLFLAGENQNVYNRSVLLLIYVVSFTAVPVMTWLCNYFSIADSRNIVVENLEIVGTSVVAVSKPEWRSVLLWVYIAGLCVVGLLTVVTWIRLLVKVHSGERIVSDGCVIVLTDDDKLAPFSWMHYVVISRHDYNNSSNAILAHELKHVTSHHWVDLLLAQIVCVLNWFNPFAWLMREELVLVHEYQADSSVIEYGYNPQEYQMLLIKKAVGSRFPSLANSLNHSNLKKRITMMKKEKSGAGSKFKALALVPMLALALSVSAIPAVRSAVTAISTSEVSKDKGSEKLPADNLPVTNSNIELMPKYPGGEAALMRAVMEKVSFPNPELKWKDGAGGTTIVGFSVMPDGTMSNFECTHSCGYGDLDQIAIDAVKNGLTEKWIPGTSNGQPVAVRFNIPIMFKSKAK